MFGGESVIGHWEDRFWVERGEVFIGLRSVLM